MNGFSAFAFAHVIEIWKVLEVIFLWLSLFIKAGPSETSAIDEKIAMAKSYTGIAIHLFIHPSPVSHHSFSASEAGSCLAAVLSSSAWLHIQGLNFQQMVI